MFVGLLLFHLKQKMKSVIEINIVQVDTVIVQANHKNPQINVVKLLRKKNKNREGR